MSAEGFSGGAIRKARAHGLKLFQFRQWTGEVKDLFPSMSLEGPPEECLRWGATSFTWLGDCQFVVNPNSSDRLLYVTQLNQGSQLFDVLGNTHRQHPTMEAFGKVIARQVSEHLKNDESATSQLFRPGSLPPHLRPEGPLGNPVRYENIICEIADPTFVRCDDKLIRINEVAVTGTLQWHYARQFAEYRVLLEVETNHPFAGAAITSYAQRPDLVFAAAFGQNTTKVHFHQIRLTEQQQNFISQLRIRAGRLED